MSLSKSGEAKPATITTFGERRTRISGAVLGGLPWAGGKPRGTWLAPESSDAAGRWRGSPNVVK